MQRRLVLHLPNLPLHDVLFESSLARNWAGEAEVRALNPLRQGATPELAFLGLPSEVVVEPGVLTVAALKAEPPARAWNFHLSLLSDDGGTARRLPFKLAPEEEAVLKANLPRLNTKTFTFLPGEQYDHALVVESNLDLGTTAADEIIGKPWAAHLPDGDGEQHLRAFIDAGLNMLSELEFNRIRHEEGQPLVNLVWPWGHGRRPELPNLAFERGEPSKVLIDSLRMDGLARLVRLRPVRSELGIGLPFKFEKALAHCDGTTTYLVLESPGKFAPDGMWEEVGWWLRELDNRFLSPMREERKERPLDLLMLFSGAERGLAFRYRTYRPAEGSVPFSLETAHEAKPIDVGDLVRNFLSE